MKIHKLINTKTKEEHLCNKITIDGFDYYVSDEIELGADSVWVATKSRVFKFKIYMAVIKTNMPKLIIATNNPNIDIPQILEEPNETLIHQIAADLGYRMLPDDLEEGIKAGYKESQETHPFSEEDMIEFAEWCRNSAVREFAYGIGETNNWELKSEQKIVTTKELLQLWKEQRTKTIYYNE